MLSNVHAEKHFSKPLETEKSKSKNPKKIIQMNKEIA